MRVASGAVGAKVAKRQPSLHAQGTESVPHRESHPEREALLDEGVTLFGLRYGRAVSREEARQMMERLTAFFDLLSEWQGRALAGPGEGEVAA